MMPNKLLIIISIIGGVFIFSQVFTILNVLPSDIISKSLVLKIVLINIALFAVGLIAAVSKDREEKVRSLKLQKDLESMGISKEKLAYYENNPSPERVKTDIFVGKLNFSFRAIILIIAATLLLTAYLSPKLFNMSYKDIFLKTFQWGEGILALLSIFVGLGAFIYFHLPKDRRKSFLIKFSTYVFLSLVWVGLISILSFFLISSLLS